MLFLMSIQKEFNYYLMKWRDNVKDKLIFVEGLDKTGKTSLCRKCRFDSGHALAIYDRGFVGRRMFQEFRGETLGSIGNWMLIEDKLIQQELYAIVWLKADINTIINRHFKAGEFLEFSPFQLEAQAEFYCGLLHCREQQGIPILELDTVKYNIDECAYRILRWAGVYS